MKKGAFFAFFAFFAANVFADTGLRTLTNCSNYPSPTANASLCQQSTTASGRTAGHVYRWSGSAWIEVGGGGGGGGVSEVDTTSPITGGPITDSGAIACPTCTTNASSLTSNLPVIGGTGNAVAVGTRSGNTTKFVTATGSPSTNDCAKWDANGNLTTAGAACGSGGGGSPGGSNTQVQYNNSSSFGGISGFTSDGTNVTAGSGNLRATSPRITTGINDANGNGMFTFSATASAVDGITVTNAATANPATVKFSATGSDSNINLELDAKGSGSVVIGSGSNPVSFVFSNSAPRSISSADADTVTMQPATCAWPAKISGVDSAGAIICSVQAVFTEPGLRLSLTSGSPVSTSEVTGAGTLYYAIDRDGNLVYYDGTDWKQARISQISLSLTLTSGKNYDVFVSCSNATTCALSLSSAWTNDNTRADALGTQDNIEVLGSDHTKLWIGTIRASGTNTTELSKRKAFVWNRYRRLPYRMVRVEPTDNWTWGTNSTWRQANGDSANQLEIVVGKVLDEISIKQPMAAAANSTQFHYCDTSIGEDSTTAPHTEASIGLGFANIAGEIVVPGTAILEVYPSSIGYHFYTWLEFVSAAGTCSFYSVAGTPVDRRSLIAARWTN